MNNYRHALPSDLPGFFGEDGMSESDRLLARLDTEHRLGLHADPHGDCPACSSEAAGLEGQRDPVTSHVERRLVDPWLVSGEQFRDLALGGFLHGAGGLQGDLVSLRHGEDSALTTEARPCNPVAVTR